MKKDDKVFFRLPKEDKPKKRVLRPGIVIGVESDVCLIQLEERAPGMEEEMDVFLHFEEKRKFLQQSARILRLVSEEPPVLSVQLHGTPVSAESRQAFRVSCLSSNIKAAVGAESGCEVVDLSVTGFAYYGQAEHETGSRVKVVLSHEGKDYAGHGTIQSSRRVTAKLLRYGVHCTDSAKDTLARSLTSINLAVQAEQLRRLAKKE